MVLAILMSLVVASGCQSIHPFAQRTKERIGVAREWANGGLEAFRNGRLQQAKGLFTRATEQRPDDFRARANLARTLHQSNETSEAITQMQQAVEQSGNDPAMLVELGEMYLATGQLGPANRQAQAALREQNRLASAWYLKGKVSRAKGDLNQALAELQKAAGLAPNLLPLQMDIAETYRMTGEPLKALVSLENLLAKHPADSQPEAAVTGKADLLMELKQYPSAIAMLQRASQQQNVTEPVMIRLGQAQLLAGQFSQARSTIARTKSMFPNTTNVAGPISDDLQRLSKAIDDRSNSNGQLVIR